MALQCYHVLLLLVAFNGVVVWPANIPSDDVTATANFSTSDYNNVTIATGLPSNFTAASNDTLDDNSTTTVSPPTTTGILPVFTTTGSGTPDKASTQSSSTTKQNPSPDTTSTIEATPSTTPSPKSETSTKKPSSPPSTTVQNGLATSDTHSTTTSNKNVSTSDSSISATTTSSDHNSKDKQNTDNSGTVTGVVIGVVLAVAILVAIGIFIVVRRSRLMRQREGYGLFSNSGNNDDDGEWTFNNPSYGASGTLNRNKRDSKGYTDI